MTDEAASAASAQEEPEEPAALFRVVRGNPTVEQIAVLAVVLAIRPAEPAAAPQAGVRAAWQRGQHAAWGGRSALLRQPMNRGPSAWRAAS